MQIFEVVRRCPHCKRESTATAREFDENPYCAECLSERLAEAAAARPSGRWQSIGGGYVQWVVDAASTSE
jgi:hypothetical protein